MKKSICHLVLTAILIGCLFICKLETNCQPVPVGLITNDGTLSGAINKDISIKNTFGIKTGSFNITDYSNYVILNNGWKDFTVRAPSDVPDVAIVKKVTFTLRVDDNANESTFWPEQFDITLNASTNPELWFTVWYADGEGHLDGGDDDDAANDSDIELNNDNFTRFNGQSAHQVFTIRFYDMDGDPSQFLIDRISMTVYWEASLPNLTTQIAPSSWSGPIVVSNQTGQNSTPPVLYAGESYVYLSLKCLDEPVPADDAFLFHFSVDGTTLKLFSVDGVAENGFRLFTNHPFTFTAGNHTLCQIVDGFNTVEESNESDNEYCHTFTWQGPPVSPALLSPGDNTLCHPTTIKLSWSSSAYATGYHLQVDNNSDFSSPEVNLPVASTSENVPGLLHNTVYYWRVRAKNPVGFGSYSDSRAFRTEPEPPATPSLTSPSDDAECQETSITLDWASSSGSMRYDLQVDNNGDFSSPVIDRSVDETEFNASGLNTSTVYYWRVSGRNQCTSSSWSTVRQFSTKGTPSAPTLAGPTNEASCQSESLTLSWNNVANASSYELKVDNNSDFSSPVVSQSGITSTSKAISGLSAGTKYYWRLKAISSCETASAWSDSWSFTTAPDEVEAPSPVEPANGQTCQPLSVTLSWTEVSGASGYRLQVDDDNDFSSPHYNHAGIPSASQLVNDLSEDKLYYWRVRASNSCEMVSSWSEVRTFSTRNNSIAVPELQAPENNANCQPLDPTLSWESVPDAKSYALQVDNNDDFSSLEYSTTCTGSSHNCTNFQQSTTYYWRVSATGDCSVTGSWSAPRAFVTGTGGMSKPSLSSPANNLSGQELSLTLTWGNVAGALNYHLQLDDNSNFASPLVDEEITSVSKAVTGLSEGTTYFWQVMANGECSSSDWSDTWKFQTFSLTGVDGEINNTGYYLKQNYPNPFSSSTTIEFSLPADEYVNFELYDLRGIVIKSWAGLYPAGRNILEVSSDDFVADGFYIFRMTTDDFVATKRFILQR